MNTNTIHIVNATGEEPDVGMMKDVLAHCQEHLVGGYKIDINVGQRIPSDAPPHKHPGWIEFAIVVYYKTVAPLRITAVQRGNGYATEFHPEREYA